MERPDRRFTLINVIAHKLSKWGISGDQAALMAAGDIYEVVAKDFEAQLKAERKAFEDEARLRNDAMNNYFQSQMELQAERERAESLADERDQAESERNNFRAVLRGMEWNELDQIAAGTPEVAEFAGICAADRIKKLRERAEKAERLLEMRTTLDEEAHALMREEREKLEARVAELEAVADDFEAMLRRLVRATRAEDASVVRVRANAEDLLKRKGESRPLRAAGYLRESE